MPSKDAHLAAARENQLAIDYLCLQLEQFPGWVATVAFYKALHVIEALFAVDGTGVDGHTDRHEQRNSVLRKTKRYQHLWTFYRPLCQTSLIARYLREDQTDATPGIFSRYMPPATVKSQILDHYLKQIEKSAIGLATAAGANFEI